MAIFHLHVKNISRGDGRSAVAAAAYRAGETLPNAVEERDSAFGGRRDVLHAEILCPKGAAPWMADRAALWNAVEASERRKDARLAKEIEAALPRELPPAAWLKLCHTFAAHYAKHGFVADFAIHDDGSGHNPHVHVLLTTRVVAAEGFGGKIRSADGRQFVEEARVLWAKLVNEALEGAGLGISVDPRSHAAAGIEREPTQHRGPDPVERQARREKMALSRLLPRRVLPEAEGTRTLQEWPGSQFSRVSSEDDRLPVPGPDGSLISQGQLADAQDRMLAELERPIRLGPNSPGRRWEADERQSENAKPHSPVMARRWADEASRSVADSPTPPAPARRWASETEPVRADERDRQHDDRHHERDRYQR
ncbi:conjugal transfer protein [Rhizobium sp. TH135]|uniref:MobQ family relaxase n=1 Tax=Rhizobium sp. TH135 TaxID=2067451 RepID=UPI000C79C725|nr:MobQ family relaxase [Rhizobium sp. TH135]PLK68683.1 conjugal transfer protein [Rhizobium sp. TH135]